MVIKEIKFIRSLSGRCDKSWCVVGEELQSDQEGQAIISQQ